MEHPRYALFYGGLKKTLGGSLQKLVFMVDRIGTANVLITFKDYPIISSCIIVAWKTFDVGFAVSVRPNKSKL